mmetsp:Transcript_68917/g.223382  ORF Transcript_68917/g.223382 Transcript_68917/m.223382 type:complete len:97 (-) Transcript_68917:102-392(-)
MRDGVLGGKPEPLDALMTFREGITPEWEHPAKADGGHVQVQLSPLLGGAIIDEYWNNLVLAMIGETLESSNRVVGAYFVDKRSGKRRVIDKIRLEL